MTAVLDPTLLAHPELASPAHLRMAYDEKWKPYPHLKQMNAQIVRWLARGRARGIINTPLRHGKTHLCTEATAAWRIIRDPNRRIAICSYSDSYSQFRTSNIRDIVDRMGRKFGVRVRRNSKAKADWGIDGYEGRVIGVGRGGAFNGRDADDIYMDDMVKDAAEAMSPTIMESVWNWYLTSVFGRVQAQSSIIAVGTRWGFNDWYGRIQEMSKKTGEKWEVIRYPALAEKADPLGRKEGEPLCPELVALQDILTAKIQGGHWFDCVYQQKPVQEEGRFFTPDAWPLYEDLGNLWSIMRPGEQRKFIPKDRCMKIAAADWAWSERETGDNTSEGLGALTDDGDLLVLDVVDEQFGPDALAPEVDRFCARGRPHIMGIEEGHPTLKRDLERQPNVPQTIHWLPPQGSRTSGVGKMARALPAMLMGQRGKIFLPAPESGLERPWMDQFKTKLKQFDGVDHGPATDDPIDMLAYLCRIAEMYRPGRSQRQQDLSWATPLIAPRETGWR
jgi:hypothetical protein